MHTATVTMTLTGPHAGKTIVLNGHRFVSGKCSISDTPERLANVTRYFKRCYEVKIDSELAGSAPNPRVSALIAAMNTLKAEDWDDTGDGAGRLPKIAAIAPLVGRYDLTRAEMRAAISSWPSLVKVPAGVKVETTVSPSKGGKGKNEQATPPQTPKTGHDLDED